ncbi:hypothetical protein KEM48_007370 [Puccinia striiformis f. sp. tritici PST-130]|nr:hypothetical protein KEM48_007370 [Puccinia striiformis f. sp. tritici PST-130]
MQLDFREDEIVRGLARSSTPSGSAIECKMQCAIGWSPQRRCMYHHQNSMRRGYRTETSNALPGASFPSTQQSSAQRFPTTKSRTVRLA